MKQYTQSEKDALWQGDPVKYAEIAHDYPCNDIPIESTCYACIMDCPLNQRWECVDCGKKHKTPLSATNCCLERKDGSWTSEITSIGVEDGSWTWK